MEDLMLDQIEIPQENIHNHFHYYLDKVVVHQMSTPTHHLELISKIFDYS